MVGMLGGQGVSFEISGTSKTSGQTFYRIPGTYSVDDSDIYHLVLCDRQRMERMVDMLVEQLQERVRSTPIPVLWSMVTEQEEVINKQLENVTNGDNIELFSMAEMVDENLGASQTKFIICIDLKIYFLIFRCVEECEYLYYYQLLYHHGKLLFLDVDQKNLQRQTIGHTSSSQTRKIGKYGE